MRKAKAKAKAKAKPKRKPLVVWGVVRDEATDLFKRGPVAAYPTRAEARNHFGPGRWKWHRVVRFVETPMPCDCDRR